MSAQEWATKAQKLQAEGKYSEAADAYDKVLEQAPIAEVYLNKGVVLSAAGRDSEALKCFDEAIKLKPELPGAHFNRANIFKSSQQPKNAKEAYEQALKLDPTSQSGWFGLAHCANELDDYNAALEAADKAIGLVKEGIHVPSHNERVFALLKLNRGSEAIKDIDIITAATPVDKLDGRARKLYSIVLSTAAIENTQSGKHSVALPYHERAAQLDPTFQNLFNHGISLLQNEKQDDALAILKKAKAADSNNWKVHAAIGTICMQKQDYKGAADAFLEAAKFPETKDDETVNFNLGVALMNLGREKEAKEPLERVTKVNRNNWTAQALLGTIYIGEEDFNKAENVLSVAAGIPGGSTDASVLYNLGYAQLMNNKSAPALDNFKKSAETDPENQQAKAAVEALTASPEEVKASVKNGLMSKMDESVRPKEGELKDLDAVLDDPAERAKVLIAPQRPHYLRRKSMEGIIVGRVFELKTKFDAMAIKDLKNKQ